MKQKSKLVQVYWMPRKLLTDLIHHLQLANNSDKLVTDIKIRKDMKGFMVETINSDMFKKYWDTYEGVKLK